MKVDFPTPGIPEMPTRTAVVAPAGSGARGPARGGRAGRPTRVIAWEIAARSTSCGCPSRSARRQGFGPAVARAVARRGRARTRRSPCPAGTPAAAPISFSVATSSGGITPPMTTMMSGRPCSASACAAQGAAPGGRPRARRRPRRGRRRRRPAGRPRRAWRTAAHVDVEPQVGERRRRSTFWPRSWPSWPILATRMRGRRPSASSNSSVASALRRGRRSGGLVLVHAADRRISAWCRPKTFSSASRSRRRWPWRERRRPPARAGCRRASDEAPPADR